MFQSKLASRLFSSPPASPFWRTHLLNKILYGTFAIATGTMIFTTFRTIRDGQPGLLALFLILYALLTAATFVYRWHYGIRAAILLMVFFCTSLASFALSGLWGNGPYFLLGFIIFTAVLFNNRATALALLLSIASLAFFSWLAVAHGQQFPLQSLNAPNILVSWVRVTLVVILVSVIISASIHYLLQRLETELDSSRADYNFVSSVLDMADVLVVVLDFQGRIVRVNRTCEQICGFTLAEIKNQFFWDIFVAAPERDSVAAGFHPKSAAEPTLQAELATPTQPAPRIISWSSSALPAGTESAGFLVTVGIDMTQQKSLLQEREHLLAAEREQRERAETLYQATAAVTSALEVQEVLDNILIQLRQVIHFDSACVFLAEEDGLRAVAAQGLPDVDSVVGKLFDVNDALFQHLKKIKQPFTITDAQKDPRFFKWGNTDYVRGWMGVPLMARQKVIGHLTLDSQTVGAYDHTNTALAQAFANQAATALVNAQLFDQTHTALTKTHALYTTIRTLISTHDLPEMLQSAANSAAEVVSADRMYIDLVDVERLQIEKTVTSHLGAPRHQSVSFDDLWDGLVGWAIRERKPAISPKNIPDPRESKAMQQLRKQLNSGSVVVAPLLYRDRALGTITAVNRLDQSDFSLNDAELLITIANQLAIAIENARMFEATNRRVTELEAVRQATLSLTSSLDLHAVLATILQVTIQLATEIQNAHIFLYQNDQLSFGAALLDDGTTTQPFAPPREDGLTYAVARQGQTIVVQDMRTHPLFASAPAHWRGSIVGIPLKISDAVVGVMTLSSRLAHNWSHTELGAIELLADQAAIAIENAHLYEQVQQHATELENRVANRTFELQTLFELAQALGQVNQIEDVIYLVLKHLHKAIPLDVAASLLMSDVINTLVVQCDHPLSTEMDRQIKETLVDSLDGWRGTQPSPLDFETHYVWLSAQGQQEPPLTELHTLEKTPITIGKTTVGSLLIARQDNTPLNDEHRRLLRIMADQTAETIGRLQLLLAAEHQRLENLITQLPDGILLLDSEQRVVLVNEAVKFLSPTLIQATIGRRLNAIGSYSLDKILESAQTGTMITVSAEPPAQQIVEIGVHTLTSGPEAGGWTLILRDVTDERLIQKRVQQQERMAAVGQLAAGIAHDFNNILTSIIGFAELLLLTDDLPAQTKEDLERITKQGHRGAYLVRQILDFSRQTIAAKHPLDMVPFIKEMVKLLERTLPEDIHISIEIEPGDYTITGDLTQLQQALTNLAVNARDAMPNGGTLKFKLEYLTPDRTPPHPEMPPGNWIALHISDTGHGIPQSVQEQIFEPFFTTKEVGKGTGLGLAQVYGIIKQHDAHIAVFSPPDQGTTFSIYLPPYSAPPKTELLLDSKDIPVGRQELILLVEDNLSVLDITKTMLLRLDYRVLTATNGVEALNIYNEHQHEINLVLTDMTMPKMGGVELMAALHQQNPAIKVVALTGYPLHNEAKELISEGMVDWLQKPLSLKSLAQTVSQSLKL